MNTLFDDVDQPKTPSPPKTKAAKAPAKKAAPKKQAAKTQSTAVTIHKPKAPAKPKAAKLGTAHDMLMFIGNAASDPNVNPEKMRDLLAIRKELKDEEAREQYVTNLLAAQKAMPKITKRGAIVIEKNGRETQRTPYARYEDLNYVIKPILQQHGFVLMHKNDVGTDGRTIVITTLKHKGGHQETSSLSLPADPSGSKNNVQGIGSAASYGKRYNTIALLNIVAEGEDDDGNLGAADPINNEQLTELIEAADKADVDKIKFCKHFKIAGMAELPAKRFHEALGMIAQRAKQTGKSK